MTEAGTGKHLVLLGALIWVAVKEVKGLGFRGKGTSLRCCSGS